MSARIPVSVARHQMRENLAVALETLRARKGRSALTVLGIVIGVTSVISVASIIDGLNGFIKQRVESMGSRVFIITRFPFDANPFRIPQKYRQRKYLKYEDALFLRDAYASIQYATAFGNRIAFNPGDTNEIRYGKELVQSFFLRGVEPEYARVFPMFSVQQGRFIAAYDEEHSRPVTVLGAGVADSLFPSVDPIGKTVRVNGRIYEVIGIFERDPGLFGGFGVDQFVCIPLSNFRKSYPEVREVFIAVSVREDHDLNVARTEVVDAMRRRRHVPYNADDDFEIGDPSFLSKLWDQLTGAMVILTGIISSIGLLVGGIGVMNIMLISVTERTQEIGVRKAIGARRSDIRTQFLFEAITLSGTGGVIGIVCGATIAWLVRMLVPSVPATLSLFWVGMGVAISVGVGLFFGYYPANQAANLDPIACLRYE